MNSTTALFSLVLLLLAFACNPNAKPGGKGGGNQDERGDVDGSGSNSIQNGAVAGSDVPSVLIPNSPASHTGNGSVSTGGPQSGGSSGQGQTETIINPNPAVSTPQGCTMQRKSSAIGGGAGLMLGEEPVAQLASVPASIALEIIRRKKNETLTTKSLCAAVLTLRAYPDVPLDYGGVSGGSRTTGNLLFPRLSLAAHCFRTADDQDVVSIVFRSLTTDPARETTLALAAPSGKREVDFFSNSIISGRTLFTASDIKFSAANDPCSIDAKATDDREKSTISEPEKRSNTPCFTLVQDQMDIITEREHAFINDYYFKAKPLPFLAADFVKTRGGSLLSIFPPAVAPQVDWNQEYSEGSSRNMTTLAVDDNLQAKWGFKSEQAVYEYLDLNMVNVKATRLVRKGVEPILPVSQNRPTKAAGGWASYLKVYGKLEKVSPESGVGTTEAFIISAISLKSTAQVLQEGDSGTNLIGEFLEVKPPLLKVRSYRQVLGVLSTVAGKAVCAGDDLLCCDRS